MPVRETLSPSQIAGCAVHFEKCHLLEEVKRHLIPKPLALPQRFAALERNLQIVQPSAFLVAASGTPACRM